MVDQMMLVISKTLYVHATSTASFNDENNTFVKYIQSENI
jgi:hypothetical protein